MLELHNGVPMAGAVLVPVNIRLSVAEMAYIIENSEARLIVATQELADTARSLSATYRCKVAARWLAVE